MTTSVNISTRQHVGAPCKPIVSVNDKVKKGQLIAEPQGLGANIHSSVYGTVTDVTDMNITILMDENQSDEYVKIPETDNYLDAIKEAGVVGSGGAGFPAHIKFKADLTDGYVIMNAAECEPLLAHNMQAIMENPAMFIRGIKYLMEITKATKGYIAIKPKHKQEMMVLGKLCKDEPNIEVKFLSDLYPAGDERVIVRELLGVILEPGQLPSVAKAVISNVETVKRVVEAIELRKPVITKDLTVGGRLVDTQDGVKVFMEQPIGMPVKHYIDKCGGYLEPAGEIVLGGPFTGKHGEETSALTKVLGGILVSMPFIHDTRKFGVLACECGAQEDRLKELVAAMGGTVVSETKCKRMVADASGRFRCEKPGECPGQAEKVLSLRKEGAEAIIVGTCEDWTNTVMTVAPSLGVAVYHSTDNVLRAGNHRLYRLKK